MPDPNSCDLIALIQNPLTADDLHRLRRLISQAGATHNQHGFVGFYSEERRVGVTATVLHGEVAGWVLFPAKDAASARGVAEALHRNVESAAAGVLGELAQAGSTVLNKARSI